MDIITLFGTLAIVFVGLSVRRVFGRCMPEGPQSSTFHKVLAVHIADTTRSASRKL